MVTRDVRGSPPSELCMIDKRLLLRPSSVTTLRFREKCGPSQLAGAAGSLQGVENAACGPARWSLSCEGCPLRLALRSTPCPIRQSCPLYLRQCSRAMFSTGAAGSSGNVCVGCGASQNSGYIKCTVCGRLRPLSDTKGPSYFELLADDTSFEVDLASTRQRYLQLQRLLHPDNYSGTEQEGESLCAADWSSFINRAYETLRNPLQRAIYLVRHSQLAFDAILTDRIYSTTCELSTLLMTRSTLVAV